MHLISGKQLNHSSNLEKWTMSIFNSLSSFHTYRVVLAEHNMHEEEGPEQSIRVAKIIIHPEWNDNCLSCGWVTHTLHL